MRICKKINEKVNSEDIEDISDAFKAAGGIKGEELIELLKLN